MDNRKPSGAIVTVGGRDFNLQPLTFEQADTLSALCVATMKFCEATLTPGMSEALLSESRNKLTVAAKDILHEILGDSVAASGSSDDAQGFEQWFAELKLDLEIFGNDITPQIVKAHASSLSPADRKRFYELALPPSVN